jgi:hypothetical protein
MEEAAELANYLPLSFKTPKEQEYIEFLWDAFEMNYTNGKYQFAFNFAPTFDRDRSHPSFVFICPICLRPELRRPLTPQFSKISSVASKSIQGMYGGHREAQL